MNVKSRAKAYTTQQSTHQACLKSLRSCTESHIHMGTRAYKCSFFCPAQLTLQACDFELQDTHMRCMHLAHRPLCLRGGPGRLELRLLLLHNVLQPPAHPVPCGLEAPLAVGLLYVIQATLSRASQTRLACAACSRKVFSTARITAARSIASLCTWEAASLLTAPGEPRRGPSPSGSSSCAKTSSWPSSLQSTSADSDPLVSVGSSLAFFLGLLERPFDRGITHCGTHTATSFMIRQGCDGQCTRGG